MSLLDSAMDRLVVPGYSKFGYAVRKRGWKEIPRLDGNVHLVVRGRERGEAAAREIGGGVVDICDISDLDSVRAYEAPGSVHALIHNAGVLPPERTTTPQGNETTLATHVLGPHLLT